MIVINSPTIDADSILGLLRRIEAANPGATNTCVISDNAAYCHSRKVGKYLATSRTSMIFLPVFSQSEHCGKAVAILQRGGHQQSLLFELRRIHETTSFLFRMPVRPHRQAQVTPHSQVTTLQKKRRTRASHSPGYFPNSQMDAA